MHIIWLKGGPQVAWENNSQNLDFAFKPSSVHNLLGCGKAYRARLRAGPKVSTILLLTASAWLCLQHSPNPGPAFQSSILLRICSEFFAALLMHFLPFQRLLFLPEAPLVEGRPPPLCCCCCCCWAWTASSCCSASMLAADEEFEFPAKKSLC